MLNIEIKKNFSKKKKKQEKEREETKRKESVIMLLKKEICINEMKSPIKSMKKTV